MIANETFEPNKYFSEFAIDLMDKYSGAHEFNRIRQRQTKSPAELKLQKTQQAYLMIYFLEQSEIELEYLEWQLLQVNCSLNGEDY